MCQTQCAFFLQVNKLKGLKHGTDEFVKHERLLFSQVLPFVITICVILTNNNTTENEKSIRFATWRVEAFAVRRTMNSPTELKWVQSVSSFCHS